MRFAYLGSGSKGNALVVEAGSTRVLLDCGLPLVEVDARLARLGLTASELTAIVVTHEHGDHIGGVAKLARRNQLPVWLTAGTRAAWKAAPDEWLRTLTPHRHLTIGDLDVMPYPVPHDARSASISTGCQRAAIFGFSVFVSSPRWNACRLALRSREVVTEKLGDE